MLLDQVQLDWFAELNRGLRDELDDEAFKTRIRATTPVLAQFSEKVARVHGAAHPETVEVHRVTMELLEELTSHMAKEEEVLFPFISQLERSAGQGAPRPHAPFGTANE